MASLIIVIHASSESDLRCVLTGTTTHGGNVFSERQKYMSIYIYKRRGPRAWGKRGREREGGAEHGIIGLAKFATHVSNSIVGTSVSSKSVIVPADSPHLLAYIPHVGTRNTRRRRYFSKRCFARQPRHLSRRFRLCQPSRRPLAVAGTSGLPTN